MSDDRQRWRTSQDPSGAPPAGGWGGEYDADATAFVQLPGPAEQSAAAEAPEGGAEYGPMASPLAAPGTGTGWEPPAIPPMTPAASTDPTATGQWTMPFAPVGEQYPAVHTDQAPGDQAGDQLADQRRPEEQNALGQGAAAALAGAHEARTPTGNQTPTGYQPAAELPATEPSFTAPTQFDPLDPSTPLDVAAAQAGGFGKATDPTDPVNAPAGAAGQPENIWGADDHAPHREPVAPAEGVGDRLEPTVPYQATDSAHDVEPAHASVPEPRSASDEPTGRAAEPAAEHADVDDLEPVPPTEPVEDSEHPLESYVLHVNGTDRPVTDAWIGESLLYVLRERLGLAGAKDGCSQGECGACSVQVDGRLVASCLVPAVTAAESEVRTVEGLTKDGEPSDVQRALAEGAGAHCGFCVPGMAMTVHDLLAGNHTPDDLEVRRALCGNLCRCSGYRGVLEAVREVSEARAAKSAEQQAQHTQQAQHAARQADQRQQAQQRQAQSQQAQQAQHQPGPPQPGPRRSSQHQEHQHQQHTGQQSEGQPAGISPADGPRGVESDPRRIPQQARTEEPGGTQ